MIARALLLVSLSGCTSTPAPLDAGADLMKPVSARPAAVMPCTTPLSEQHAATRAFREALLTGDRAARAGVIDQLDAAAKAHPKEAQLALLGGLAHLWRVAEPAGAKDEAAFVASALAARTALEEAYALCPTDYRIPAWLGPVLVNMGRAVSDPKIIERGLAVLQEGIDKYPAFVLFSKLLVYADRPASDPDFQKALQAVDENVGACGDVATSRDPACTNGPYAVHNVEGAAIFLGDVYAKAGRRAAALATYEQGQKGSGFATWPYQQLLKERIAGLDARVAAHADMDPKNDPEAAWTSRSQCAVCHQR